MCSVDSVLCLIYLCMSACGSEQSGHSGYFFMQQNKVTPLPFTFLVSGNLLLMRVCSY